MRIQSDKFYSKEIFQSPAYYKNEILSNSTLEKCNASHCIFYGGNISGVKILETDFSNSRFFEGVEVKSSEFTLVDFRSVGCGPAGVFFESCRFFECNFWGASLGAMKFKNCYFKKCKIKEVKLDASVLEDCKISGEIIDIDFFAQRPNMPLRIDFKDCTLDYVSFSNCDLSTSIPPSKSNHIYIDRIDERMPEFKKILELIQPPQDIKKKLTRRLKKLSDQKNYIFNLKNIADIEGVDYLAFFEKVILSSHA